MRRVCDRLKEVITFLTKLYAGRKGFYRLKEVTIIYDTLLHELTGGACWGEQLLTPVQEARMCIEAAPFHVDTLALCNHVSLRSKLLLHHWRRLWYVAVHFSWQQTCVQSNSHRGRLKGRPIHVLLQ